MAARVVILDNIPLLRHGLATAAHTDGLEVTGTAPLDEIRESLAGPRPDVVLLGLPDGADGRAELRSVRRALPEVPVLVFADETPGSRELLLADGADSHLDKGASVRAVVGALREVAARLPSTEPRREPPSSTTLTRRELDVLVELAKGRTNAAIAEVLFVAASTVKTHVSNLLRKLGAASRAEAVSEGHKRRLV